MLQFQKVKMQNEGPPSSGPKKTPPDLSKAQTTVKLCCPMETQFTFGILAEGSPVRNPPAELDCDHMCATRQVTVFYTELFPLEIATAPFFVQVREGGIKEVSLFTE